MTSSVDGLVSGLNTTQIISQLMQVEAAPQTALKNRQTQEQVKVAAYQAVNTSVAALLTAAQSLTSQSLWQSVKATSSDSSVTTSTSAGATAGSLTFDVTKTAAAEIQVSGTPYSGLAASVLSGSALTFTKSDNSTVTVTPTDGSLSSVVSAINGTQGLGVRAAAVAIGDGTYALQLTSTSTGDAAKFSVTGLTQTLTETSAAHDAELSLAGVSTPIKSSTNTFTNLVPGLTFTVSAPKTGVRIDLSSDSQPAADAVQKLVDAANAALNAIADNTAYDPTKKQGAPLTGDSTMRSLQTAILSTVSTAIGGTHSASEAGISLTKDGHLQFDQGKFTDAFVSDPTSLQALVGPSLSFTGAGAYTGGVTLLRSTERTQEVTGGHSLVVTQAATRSTAAIDLGTLDATSTVTIAGVTVTGQAGDTADTFTARVNAALNAKGLGASLSGATMTVTSTGYGASTAFTPTVSGSGLTLGAVTGGTDVAGTIDGKAATGLGQILTGASGSTADGLSLVVTLSAADVAAGGGSATGTLNFQAGVAQRLASVANAATDAVSGSITSLISSGQQQIQSYTDDIAAWDVRLSDRQAALQKQYADLEVALGKLKDQSTWLSGQIAGLPSYSSK